MTLKAEYNDLSQRYHSLNDKEMERLLDLRDLLSDRERHDILSNLNVSFPEVYRLRAKFKGSDETE